MHHSAAFGGPVPAFVTGAPVKCETVPMTSTYDLVNKRLQSAFDMVVAAPIRC